MPHKLINPSIPLALGLNTEAFGSIFDRYTTSYKFLWMKGIIKILEEDIFQKEGIPIMHLVKEMLLASCYPVLQFRLSFGRQDRIPAYLFDLLKECDGSIGKVERHINKNEVPKNITKDLARYVPYLLLSPFFATELRGISSSLKKSNEIKALANEMFLKASPPLYRLDDKAIYVHQRWREYIRDNLPVVKGWQELHWIKYLQRRNPTVPAIPSKTKKPEIRTSMNSQIELWRGLLNERRGLRCIYSEDLLASKDLALDHYLPWSFVVHNEIWNLVPTSQSVNSSKSDKLPDERYREKFIDMQHLCVTYINENCQSRRKLWQIHKEVYEDSLQVDLAELADRSALEKAYAQTLDPLLTLARRSGFHYSWTYKSQN